jgi:haloalkane dehalogenase
MDVFRTPDAFFRDLPDFRFAPNYLKWDGLRTHYLDEGPREAPVALLLHGEPTWSFLYRSMIPPLVAAGYRCVAPDHIGFGRSDKVLDDRWYVIDRHVERLSGFIERLDLRRITLFVQDWGGPIGLINVATQPERFQHLAILNTWLHHEGYEYTAPIRAWRAAATDRFWLGWLGGDLPCGRIVTKSLARRPSNVAEVTAAYEAPFGGHPAAKAGARRFPYCIPFGDPDAGAARRQAEAFDYLTRSWTRPAHFVFGADDPMFPASWGERWAARFSTSTFDSIPRAGHFVQEDAGPEIVATFLRRRGPLTGELAVRS